jgi:hypothetical protein
LSTPQSSLHSAFAVLDSGRELRTARAEVETKAPERTSALSRSERGHCDVVDIISAIVWSALPDGSNVYVNSRFPAPRPACPPPTSARASAAPRTASKEAGSAPTTTPPPPRRGRFLIRMAWLLEARVLYFAPPWDSSRQCKIPAQLRRTRIRLLALGQILDEWEFKDGKRRLVVRRHMVSFATHTRTLPWHCRPDGFDGANS